jgi:hypothetical protein
MQLAIQNQVGKKTAHLIDLEHAIGNKKKLRIEYENRMNMFYHKNL